MAIYICFICVFFAPAQSRTTAVCSAELRNYCRYVLETQSPITVEIVIYSYRPPYGDRVEGVGGGRGGVFEYESIWMIRLFCVFGSGCNMDSLNPLVTKANPHGDSPLLYGYLAHMDGSDSLLLPNMYGLCIYI